jgi:large subunit ribosomal protein L24e
MGGKKMQACSFCKKQYENPRGLTVFTFDGKSIFYCSSKCRNNAKLGRDPKKTNWVKREKKIKIKSDKSGSGPKVKKVEVKK